MKSEKLKIEVINFKTSKNYQYNLEKIKEIIKNSPADFLLFPEVCLTGFDYENWQKVNEFASVAIKELSKLKKAFALTIVEDNKNYFCLFDNGLVYKRAKFNLFGNEKKFFEIGLEPETFNWRGLKVGNLICFELRFIKYWEKFKGVDLILVPARWGKERIEHFRILNKALALSIQTNVIFSNSFNEVALSGMYNAWGEGIESKIESVIFNFDFKTNKQIRKKINIGIE